MTDHEVWEEGTVLIDGESIRAVERGRVEAHETIELSDSFILPGFVDLQVNGAFGVDVATEPGSLRRLSAKLPSTGTTSYLPTIVSRPLSEYDPLLSEIELVAAPAGAEPLGLHLEGPFLNPERKGAHLAENLAAPDAGFIEAVLEAAPVRLVTLAPELEGATGLLEVAAGSGVVASLGHSVADFGTASRALDAGAESVTHLFNAMGSLHHRDPGLPGAALGHPRAACGIIADGRHLHPEIVKLAFRLLGPDRMYLVTDAIAAAGMGSGEYSLAGRRVSVENDTPRLEDGTIAGSVLQMDEALRNTLHFTDCTLPEAVRMVSATPARLIGEGERKGRLAPGYDADIMALSPELELEAVWLRGKARTESSALTT